MKNLKRILNNQNGHGQAPSGKDAVKIAVAILTVPVWGPFALIYQGAKKLKKKIKK
jgi:hypothetical protein